MTFLNDLISRPLNQGADGLRPEGLFIGNGDLALEVAVYSADARPTAKSLQDAWKARRAGRSTPVLVVVLHNGKAWLGGPTGEALPIHTDKDPGAIERLCQSALKQPDRHAALLFLAQALPSLDTIAPGLRNEGLFALHELTEDAPRRAEWAEHGRRSRAMLNTGAEGQELLRRLGYTVERLDNVTQLLRGFDRRLGLAILLDRTDVPEAGSPRFGNLSPVSYALSKADSENLDWVMVLQGDRLRLYPTKVGVGVGRRGRTETYVELQTSLLADDHLAYLSLIFSADALRPDGSVSRLLEDSRRFAASLADRLRDRIYDSVMPRLAQAVAAARDLVNPSVDDLDLTYRMAITVLFRLLFVAYAEDRDLLPYRHSEAYRVRSLKHKAQELAANPPPYNVAPGTRHWDEVERIWTAIERGDTELSVPPYNGGLFTRDPTISQAGAALAELKLPNEALEPALRDLLLSDVENGQLLPVDFRALGVREFGTIYEGLLESELSVADQDLAVDTRGSYVPVRGRVQPVVLAGEIYLHDRSGARKASGSYFTKSFAVEHLLDRALVPALNDHLARVSTLDDAGAAESFFDFRVADIAMGSGHFLVAAIDRIEKAFTGYLAQENARGAAGIRNELARLKEAARNQLGDMADQMAFEDSQLLRRLIARRCIYGVDLNPLSVELARLAIWIHTFVPGLPLSVLDHNLVNGNALIGVGALQEIRDVFEAAGTSLFPVDADNLLGQARQSLRRFANLADASLADVAHARDAIQEARLAVADTKALCDIITAGRMDGEIRYQFENWERDRAQIQSHLMRHRSLVALEGLKAFHFPVAFPEVFLRSRSGFDVLLGNPPWEKLHVEEHEFWSRHFPGIRGLTPRALELRLAEIREQRPDLQKLLNDEIAEKERQRRILTGSPVFPGMGSGHPDLYKAFVWRFWHLLSEGGRSGLVLPRNVFSSKGTELFRRAIFAGAKSIDLTSIVNTAGWVFPNVHQQFTIVLSAIQKGAEVSAQLTLAGPFRNEDDFRFGIAIAPAATTGEVALGWNATASLPLLPQPSSIGTFLTMREAPNFKARQTDRWDFRPEQEINAVSQKSMFDLISEEIPHGFWPVYKGESFDIWSPDTGSYNGFVDPGVVVPWLQRRRIAGARRADGPSAGLTALVVNDKSTLPCFRPRIAFRDVSRATDSRTVRVALVPANRIITHTAPHLIRRRGDESDEAFLLGVMCSLPFDWFARRYVETHLTFFLLNDLPVPRPPQGDRGWQRVVELAGRLASVNDHFADWAEAVGVECGALAPDTKQDMMDELDAVVAHLYGLDEEQLTHIFETFHEGWDFEPRLTAVKAHFRNWAI